MKSRTYVKKVGARVHICDPRDNAREVEEDPWNFLSMDSRSVRKCVCVRYVFIYMLCMSYINMITILLNRLVKVPELTSSKMRL